MRAHVAKPHTTLLVQCCTKTSHVALRFPGYISFIVKAIRLAMKAPKGRYRGFTVLELLQGLSRIAVSEGCKRKASSPTHTAALASSNASNLVTFLFMRFVDR